MDWEGLAWSRGVRRFRDKDGTTYSIRAKPGWTGRYGSVTVEDEGGNRQVFTRREALANEGVRFDLFSGETLCVRIHSALEERLETLVDNQPTTFAPCKPMKRGEFAKLLRSTGRHSLVQAGITGVLAASLIVVAVMSSLHGSLDKVLLLAGLAGLFAYVSVGALREGLDFRRGEESALHLVLRDAPAEILWVYPKTTTRITIGAAMMGAAVEHTVVVKLGTRRDYEVRMSALQLESALRMFEKRAPHAAMGFSSEERSRYEQLLRSAS